MGTSVGLGGPEALGLLRINAEVIATVFRRRMHFPYLLFPELLALHVEAPGKFQLAQGWTSS